MKRSLLLTGILLPVFVYAQNADTSARKRLLTTAPRLGGVTITEQVAPVKANGGSFLLQQPVVDVSIPVCKDLATAHPLLIKTGFRYEGLLLSNEKQLGSINFHALTLPFLLSYSITRQTNISLIGLATAASDFRRSIDPQDLIYTAGVRIGFRPANTLRYGITFTYIHNYWGDFLLPIPDIDWTIDTRWSLTAILPARASLKYKLSAGQFLGITSGYMGGMYLLNNTITKQYLNLQQFSGGLLYDVTVSRRWKLNLIAGHTFLQRLETFNLDQKVSFDNFGKLNSRVSNISYRQNSIVFQGGLSYAF